MYRPLANWLARVCRVPPQPESPPGDEATTVVFRAAPGYWRYRMTGWAIGAAFALLAGSIPLILAVAAPIRDRDAALTLGLVGLPVLAFVVLLCFLSWITVRLDYENRWYLLTDRSLRVREGVWIVREMTITFANVQNLSVDQGPLQRLFGISNVKVETAGGGGGGHGSHGEQMGRSLHTAWLRGVDNAVEVKELIQRRIRGLRDAGLGDLDDKHAVPAQPGALIEAAGAVAEMLAEAKRLRAAVAALASRGS